MQTDTRAFTGAFAPEMLDIVQNKCNRVKMMYMALFSGGKKWEGGEGEGLF